MQSMLNDAGIRFREHAESAKPVTSCLDGKQ